MPGSQRPSLSGPIVLVGLSGAGKTTVATCLAQLLGWDLLDLDAEVERLAGRPIATMFETGGEREFRELEERVTRSAALREQTVIAAGGGWMARPDLRDTWPGASRVWLRVQPAVALERLADDGTSRPLLAGADPEAALKGLLAERLPAYALAEYTVETGGRTVDQIARAILAELEQDDSGSTGS